MLPAAIQRNNDSRFVRSFGNSSEHRRTKMKPTTKVNTQFSPYQLTGKGPICGSGFQLILIIKNLCLATPVRPLGVVQLLPGAPDAPTQSNNFPLTVFLSKN